MNIYEFFSHPNSIRQRQYEALRAFVLDKLQVEEVAKKFGYQISTIYTLVRD